LKQEITVRMTDRTSPEFNLTVPQNVIHFAISTCCTIIQVDLEPIAAHYVLCEDLFEGLLHSGLVAALTFSDEQILTLS
jgi:hypothetical protein